MIYQMHKVKGSWVIYNTKDKLIQSVWIEMQDAEDCLNRLNEWYKNNHKVKFASNYNKFLTNLKAKKRVTL